MNTTAQDISASPGQSAALRVSRNVADAYKPFPIWRLVAWLVLGWIVLEAVMLVGQNPNFGWATVGEYLFHQNILDGLKITLGLSVVSMALGILFGLVIALMRMSPDRLLSGFAAGFLWFFRAVPLLVQLIFWYNLSALFPEVKISIPFGPELGAWETNSLISPLTAAIIGLALHEAAYMAEIIRGGLLSVDRGQIEATQAFGMSRARALRRVILPQAMRFIVPPSGNQFISMVKATSLVSVIAMSDLLYSVQAIYNRTFEVIPLLLVAAAWYLFIVSLLNVGQEFLERHFGRSERGVVDDDALSEEAES
ncbi:MULTISPECIES: amino acid ABC transporter permease [Chelativorans]|jgi:polar amino acid transport system permease protein|uniref:Glutamate/aspartate import permease protein GltK n=1 Tax=Chelativorans sp. (strain BNC1) TaxID=266779 RepID=Q11MD0_CHESB|nr:MULTISPECIES: amino acid ABC transporter permease [Chelativorans]